MFNLRSDTSPDPVNARALCHVYKRQVCSVETVRASVTAEPSYRCRVHAQTKCLEVAVQASYCELEGSTGRLEARTYYPAGQACVFSDCNVPKDFITIHNLQPLNKNSFCYAAAVDEFE